MFKLNDYFDFTQLESEKYIEYCNSKNIKVKVKDKFKLLKYDKKMLNSDNIDTLGLFRSVIVYENKVVSFAPPKSENLINLNVEQENLSDYEMQEYVEGTMINIFWSDEKNDWEISTRSNIGGKCCFNINFDPQATFRYMFLDAMNHTKLEFEHLNKNFSYSFVLQHPSNRIVVPMNNTRLFSCCL